MLVLSNLHICFIIGSPFIKFVVQVDTTLFKIGNSAHCIERQCRGISLGISETCQKLGRKKAQLRTSIGESIKFLFCHIYTSQVRHSARGAGQEPRAPRRACRWPYLFIWPDIRRFALLVGLLATSRPSGPAGAWLLMISDSGRISPSSNFFCKLSTTASVS